MPSFPYPFIRVHLDATPASLPLSEHSIYLLLIRKSKFVAGAVEPRMTRLVLRGAGYATGLPFIRLLRSRPASRPFSTIVCRTVASGGVVHPRRRARLLPSLPVARPQRVPPA